MHPITFDHLSYLTNDERIFLISGEIHYFRVPRDGWRDRLEKMKAAGGNCVATYVPWLLHEPEEGRYNFSDRQLDIDAFLTLCTEVGLWAIVRPGPYQYSELAYDGLPGWLCEGYPDLRAQTLDGHDFRISSISYLHPLFLKKARRWYHQVIPLLARHQVSRGGAVAAVQVDNELMGIHEWFGSLDYHPAAMGVGGEQGRWPDFLRTRYGSLDAVNISYGLAAKSWASVLPITSNSHGRAEDQRRLKDYGECYNAGVAEYAHLLGSWLREEGIDVPIVHNSPNPTQNADFREVVDRMGQDFLLGSDHYYALDMDWDSNNPSPKYAAKCYYSLEELRLLGVPPTVFEMPGGSLSDFPPITAPDAECAYLLNVAYGLKGYNYYIFAGGYNVPGTGTTSEVYDYGAAVSPDGVLRDLYWPQQRLGHFLRNQQWLAGAHGVADCQIGLNWEHSRSRRYGDGHCEGITFSNNDAWNLFWKGMLMTAFSAGLCPSLADLYSDELLAQTALPLVVPTANTMARHIQERLVGFIQAGGRVLLAPVTPTLDEDYRPCTILSEFLGSPVQEAYRCMAPQLTAFDVHNVYVNGGLFATTTRPTETTVVAREERGGAEIGWRRDYPGGGSVIIFGLHWKHGKHEHAAMLTNALAGLGLQRRVRCSNPNIWTALRSDGRRTMLFLLNLFTAPQTVQVSFQHPATGMWLDTGEQCLPGISVRAWMDGRTVYQTGAIAQTNGPEAAGR